MLEPQLAAYDDHGILFPETFTHVQALRWAERAKRQSLTQDAWRPLNRKRSRYGQHIHDQHAATYNRCAAFQGTNEPYQRDFACILEAERIYSV